MIKKQTFIVLNEMNIPTAILDLSEEDEILFSLTLSAKYPSLKVRQLNCEKLIKNGNKLKKIIGDMK